MSNKLNKSSKTTAAKQWAADRAAAQGALAGTTTGAATTTSKQALKEKIGNATKNSVIHADTSAERAARASKLKQSASEGKLLMKKTQKIRDNSGTANKRGVNHKAFLEGFNTDD